MRKINEIFYSLQGEGRHTGTPAVFVRFSGCNLSCDFCDTDHNDGAMMSDEEIIAAIMQYRDAPMIVITGGEPSLFIDHEFIEKLKRETHKYIAIETNGTCGLPVNIDWITLSPKQGFEGGDKFPVIIDKCNELKVVYKGQQLEPYFNIKAEYYYLQPCSTGNPEYDNRNITATIGAVLKDTRWKLSLQTHKLLDIR